MKTVDFYSRVCLALSVYSEVLHEVTCKMDIPKKEQGKRLSVTTVAIGKLAWVTKKRQATKCQPSWKQPRTGYHKKHLKNDFFIPKVLCWLDVQISHGSCAEGAEECMCVSPVGLGRDLVTPKLLLHTSLQLILQPQVYHPV